MIAFTDKRLYVKGTCMAMCSDPITGQVLYFSNKFQTGNFETSVTLGEIRAGLGNSIAAIIPSDAAVNVNFVAADFSMWAKAAQVGAPLNYNAVVPTCQVVTATGSSLTIDVSGGAPAAQYGYGTAFCHVQKVGEASAIANDGKQYAISAEGAVDGFTAVSGEQYKVWYFVNQANAQVAAISTMFDPRVVHFTAQIAVYSNDVSSAANEGTRVGWLYVIVPRLKMNGTATVTGDQSTGDTTSLQGQAIAYDESVVSATCQDCNSGNLAYYIYAPDGDADGGIAGLAVVGGVVTVAASSTAQIPVRYVMDNGQLVAPNYGELTYELSGAPSGTTVGTTNIISAGATAGDCECTIKKGDSLTTICNVSVTA